MNVCAETTPETETHLLCWWLYAVINVQHAACTCCSPGSVPSRKAQQQASTLPAPQGCCLSKLWYISLIQKACAAYAYGVNAMAGKQRFGAGWRNFMVRRRTDLHLTVHLTLGRHRKCCTYITRDLHMCIVSLCAHV